MVDRAEAIKKAKSELLAEDPLHKIKNINNAGEDVNVNLSKIEKRRNIVAQLEVLVFYNN